MRKSPTKRATSAELSQRVSALNTELLNIPFLNGVLVENVVPNASNEYVIKHNLGRPYRGFFCLTGDQVYEVRSNPSKDKELRVTSSSFSVTTGIGRELLGTYTFGSSLATATLFTGLDGDTDERYYISGTVEMATSSLTDLEWNLNGAAASGWGATHYYGSATHGYRNYTTGCYAGYFNSFLSSTYLARIEATVYATSGVVRDVWTQYSEFSGDTNVGPLAGDTHGVWTDTAANLTSIGITASTTWFAAGSEFKIYRDTPAASASVSAVSRPLSFWVY